MIFIILSGGSGKIIQDMMSDKDIKYLDRNGIHFNDSEISVYQGLLENYEMKYIRPADL